MFFVEKIFAHKEWVHQYMVKQAFYLLEQQRGVNYNVFNKRDFGINYWGSSPTDYYGKGNDADPWSNDCQIAIGAWRDDVEDPVFGYVETPSSLITGEHQTNSHFWVTDNGDNYKTPILNGYDYYNSWQKARIYLFNGNNFEITIVHNGTATIIQQNVWGFPQNQSIPVQKWKITYNSIFDLYNGNFTITQYHTTGFFGLVGQWISPSYPSNTSFLGISGKDLALQILGRVAHLLGDQSVPTHAHGKLHPCPVGAGDYYELDMADYLLDPNCELPPNFNSQLNCQATNWDYNSALQQGGLLNDIYCMSDQDALHYLFYSTNQMADFFPSGGGSLPYPNTLLYPMFSGNNIINSSDNAYTTINSIYSTFNNTSPTSVSTQQIAGVAFNYAIRSCASLFNWFQTRLQDYQPTAYVQNANTSNGSSITTLATNVPGSIYVTNTKTKVYAHWGIEAGNNVTTAYSTGDFVVANGTAAKFLAGSSIHLQPGFKVEAGADFQAKIITFPCTGPSARQPNQEQFNDSDLIRLVHIGTDSIVPQKNTTQLSDNKLTIFPNPFTQTTTLQFTNTANEEFTLDVFDIAGRVVFTMPKITGTQYRFNRNNLAEGIYLLKLKSNTKSYIERLVVQD
ncbi:MAG: hypothetical protein RJA07_692 [Bacteroidota bacterium]